MFNNMQLFVSKRNLTSSIQPIEVKTTPPQEWVESETPYAFITSHILSQIEQKGLYKTQFLEPDGTISSRKEGVIKQRLHVSISITDLMNVDPVEEEFSVKYRIYIMWEIDLHNLGFSDLAEKALRKGHFYSMTRAEIIRFSEVYKVPDVQIFNQVSKVELDLLDIRVYGGKEGETAVMANQAFSVKCRQRFTLHDFPFDKQELTIEYYLNDPRSWEMFNLTINSVQFHKNCLSQIEWFMLVPQVRRDIPKEAKSIVVLPVRRRYWFYVQNILLLVVVLAFLGLICFAMEPDQVGDRAQTVLTLLLTTVAFKLTVAQGVLPKVSYNTILDHYMLGTLASLCVTTVLSILPSFADSDRGKEDLNGLMALVALCFLIILYSILIFHSVSVMVNNRCVFHIPSALDKTWLNFRFSTPGFLEEVEGNMVMRGGKCKNGKEPSEKHI